MSEAPLKAQFFVTRENDTMVPLVALDELPDHIIIKDVPRIIRPSNIQGMHCVGVFECRHKKHVVTNINQSPFTPLNTHGLYASFADGRSTPAPAFNVSAPQFSFPASQNPFKIEQSYPGMRLEDAAEAQQLAQKQAIEAAVTSRKHSLCSTQSLTSPPVTPTPESKDGSALKTDSGSKAAPGVKEFCSYWLRKGECDYAQQGCLYKHEMPLDKDTLNRLGLRDIPQWYRELHGVGSFLAVHGAGASFSGPGLKSVVSTDDKPRGARAVREWKGDSSTGDSSAVINRLRRTGPRHVITSATADTRGSTQAVSKRGAMINSRPRRELILKNSSPLTGQPKLRSHETVAHRQNLATIKALEAHKKLEASGSTADNGLLRSKFAAVVVDNDNKIAARTSETPNSIGPAPTSSGLEISEAPLSELDVSGYSTARGGDVSDLNDDDVDKGPDTDPHQGVNVARPRYIHRHRNRAPSNASTLMTDVEAEFFRSDAERRAREDAAYATIQAEQERNHAVRLAKLKLDKLKLVDSTRGLMEKIDSLKDDMKMSAVGNAIIATTTTGTTNYSLESSRAESMESGRGGNGSARGGRRSSNGKGRSGVRGRQNGGGNNNGRNGKGNLDGAVAADGNGNGNGKGKGLVGKANA